MCCFGRCCTLDPPPGIPDHFIRMDGNPRRTNAQGVDNTQFQGPGDMNSRRGGRRSGRGHAPRSSWFAGQGGFGDNGGHNEHEAFGGFGGSHGQGGFGSHRGSSASRGRSFVHGGSFGGRGSFNQGPGGGHPQRDFDDDDFRSNRASAGSDEDIGFGGNQHQNHPAGSPQHASSLFDGGSPPQGPPRRSEVPATSNRRNLRPGELDNHMRPGGQTNAGERPRGAPGPSVYMDRDGPGRIRGGGESGFATTSTSGHPWHPETEMFAREQTRRL